MTCDCSDIESDEHFDHLQREALMDLQLRTESWTGSARSTDPDTSKQATQRGFGPQAARVLWAVTAIERNGGHGATVHEVRLLLQRLDHPLNVPQQNVIARRLTDLARLGLIEDTGDRRQGGYGVDVIVWRSTLAGREHAA